jgi:sugar phosphate permease
MGDFAASTGFGYISDVGGWDMTFFVMAILAFVAAIIAGIGRKQEEK